MRDEVFPPTSFFLLKLTSNSEAQSRRHVCFLHAIPQKMRKVRCSWCWWNHGYASHMLWTFTRRMEYTSVEEAQQRQPACFVLEWEKKGKSAACVFTNKLKLLGMAMRGRRRERGTYFCIILKIKCFDIKSTVYICALCVGIFKWDAICNHISI